jgi:phosphoglycerate dehydrogenase-like enzyme
MSFVRWVHSITSGVEQILIPEIVDNPEIVLTNAKGVFSSSLAEYVLGACFYFAKDIPRFLEQQRNKVWKKFVVGELKGATMGIIGYGDIGFHCAKLAKAYGMKVLALRRFPNLSNNDGLCDEVLLLHFMLKIIRNNFFNLFFHCLHIFRLTVQIN